MLSLGLGFKFLLVRGSMLGLLAVKLVFSVDCKTTIVHFCVLFATWSWPIKCVLYIFA